MQRQPKRWLILIVLCLSTLVLVVDNMALNVAIPSLTSDLGASSQDIQWIMDAYILVFAGLLLPSGSLSDRFGRRRVMVIGLAVFGLASLAGSLAASPEQLIAARVAMGVGGALIMPSTLSILIVVFDDEERRKAMGVWSVVAMVGLVGGPVLGGALIAWFWWGSVLLLNVPIAVLAIVAAVALMPESKGPWSPLDPIGAVLCTVGMTALVWAIIELPKNGLGHSSTIGAFVVAAASLLAFGIWETRTAHPMVPLQLFRDRNFSGTCATLVILQIGYGGLLLGMTQYLQFVLGYSATEAGLAFIPMAVAMILVQGVAGTLGQKVGNRPLIVSGLLVMAAGFGVLATVSSTSGFLTLGIALAVMGAGSGLASPAAIASLMAAVPPENAGVGSALNDTIGQAGAALGVAVLGSVLASSFDANMPASAPEQAHRSIADALGLASANGDSGLAATAREAFTSAMSVTSIVGTCAVVVAAVIAFLVVRDRKSETPADIDEAQPERMLETV